MPNLFPPPHADHHLPSSLPPSPSIKSANRVTPCSIPQNTSSASASPVCVATGSQFTTIALAALSASPATSATSSRKGRGAASDEGVGLFWAAAASSLGRSDEWKEGRIVVVVLAASPLSMLLPSLW